jgi:hypothetical protein
MKRDSLGGALDLDLLSPFPQKDATNSGGIERMNKLFKVNNGGERMDVEEHLDKRWEKGIYRGSTNVSVGAENWSGSHLTGTTSHRSGTTSRVQNSI